MSTTTRLLAAAGTVALLATITPPAGAEPADGRYLDQVVTIAGFDLVNDEGQEKGVSGDGGPATAARLGAGPVTIDVGPDGTVYTADEVSGRLRMIDDAGVITTVPGTAQPPIGEGRELSPVAVATSADDVVHVAGQELVYRMVNGTAEVLAGAGAGGDGGPAAEADFGLPADIDVDAAGAVYVADKYRGRIRKIDQNGIITTVAGGEGTDVGKVLSLAVDSTGAIYFTEEDATVVRKVAPDGTLSTVTDKLGSTEARLAVDERDTVHVIDGAAVRTIDEDGTLAAAGPPVDPNLRDIAVGPDGNVYLAADRKILMLVRNGKPAPAVLPTKSGPAPGWASREPGTVVTLAGNGKAAGLPEPPFDPPLARSVAAGADGTTYVSDTAGHQVLAIGRDGRRTVFAGTGKAGDSGDGGPATEATLTEPRAIAVGADGAVYIAEKERIRQVAPDGTIGLRATVAADDLAVDGSGVLYAGTRNTVARIDLAGTATTLTGAGEALSSVEWEGLPAAEAGLLNTPDAVAVDATGVVYFVNPDTAAVFAIERDGSLRTVVGNAEFPSYAGGFAGDGGPATAGQVNNVSDLALGPDGSLYLTDSFNNRIRRIDPTGTISTVAGTGAGGDTGDDGPAAKAAFTEPRGLAVAADGTITVTNRDTDRLRRIDPAGTVTSVTGLDGPTAAHAGSATNAVLGTHEDLPLDVAVGQDDTLYVTGFGRTHTVSGDGRIADFSPPLALAGDTITAGPDGTLYLHSHRGLTRLFPDGTVSTLVSGEYSDKLVGDGSPALGTSLGISHAAVGVKGELYVAGSHTIFQVRKGKLHRVARTDAELTGLAVGPDGALYAGTEAQVMRIDEAGALSVFAGTGDYSADNGDGGPADEASLEYVSGLAVSPAGIVYIGTPDGVRAVDQDGEINTIVPAAEDPSAVAVDRHGNLLYTTTTQVKAVVRADEVDLAGVNWSALLWGAAAVAVLGLGGWWILRRRAARAPAVHSGPVEETPRSNTDPEHGSEPS